MVSLNNLQPIVFYPQQHLQYSVQYDLRRTILLHLLLLISSGPEGLNIIQYNSVRASLSTTVQYSPALHTLLPPNSLIRHRPADAQNSSRQVSGC